MVRVCGRGWCVSGWDIDSLTMLVWEWTECVVLSVQCHCALGSVEALYTGDHIISYTQ